MNWAKFKKNIGMRVQLEPIVCRLDEHGHELPEENDDWIVQSISGSDVVTLYNISTCHVAELGKDHIYDFRSNPSRSKSGITYGFLVLKVQIFLQGKRLWLRPNSKPGERVPHRARSRQRPLWTQFLRIDASAFIPSTASFARIQYRLWADDDTIPLMIRVASAADGKLMQELSGPSGVMEQLLTEEQAFYVSLSHPRVRYDIAILGYRFD